MFIGRLSPAAPLRSDRLCPDCEGTGRVYMQEGNNPDTWRANCPTCEGLGKRALYTPSRRRFRGKVVQTSAGLQCVLLGKAAQSRRNARHGWNSRDLCVRHARQQVGFARELRTAGFVEFRSDVRVAA